MKVALLVCDGGDGYSCVHFFRNIEDAEVSIQEYEQYYCNEGSPDIIDVPDDWLPPEGYWHG